MAYQNNGYNPVLSQQMYGDARGRETVPHGQAQPMQHMHHMQQQQFYPSPYAYIKPQQSQAQALAQAPAPLQIQAQAQAQPQIQPQPLQYGGGGGTMAPPPNMAAMSGGMMPAAMSHQQMHMRNTSSERQPACLFSAIIYHLLTLASCSFRPANTSRQPSSSFFRHSPYFSTVSEPTGCVAAP